MTDKKFTDEEIITALEYHINAEDCVGCEMFGRCDEIILTELILDLINRQKAEIERLKGSTIVNNIMESQRIKREAKAKAYKEFAERLKQHKRKMRGFDLNEEFWDYAVLVENIDNLLKEMVGD